MADRDPVLSRLDHLQRMVLELKTFADLSVDLQGDADPDAPQWPWLVMCMADRIDAAYEDVESHVRAARRNTDLVTSKTAIGAGDAP